MFEPYDIICNKNCTKIYWSSILPPTQDSEYVYAIDINNILSDKWDGTVKLVYIGGLDYRHPKDFGDLIDRVLPVIMQQSANAKITYKQKLEAMHKIVRKIYTHPCYKIYQKLSKELKQFDL